MQDKELLLVMDNFEQVIPAASFVADLLAGAPGIRILVTSRTPLHVSGEQTFPVPPMVVPEAGRLPPIEELLDYASINLFLERARAVRPDFELTDRNAGIVIDICRQLDGLPLAIELAAARVRVLTLEDILRRLREGLGILAGGAKDLPSRQQTLKNAIAWSYDLLDEPSAQFFVRLGAFSGGWSFEAADAVCNPEGELGVDSFEALELLVDSSLVRSVHGERGETRFRMLQTIREFAIELLSGTKDASTARRRHASHFREMARELVPKLTQEGDAPERLTMDHDNLRAALRWFIDNDIADGALDLGTGLWRFWQIRGHLTEGREWLTEALALPGAQAATATRAKALIALGSLTYWQNDWPSTRRSYEEALAICRDLGDPPGIAEAAYNAAFLGLVEVYRRRSGHELIAL